MDVKQLVMWALQVSVLATVFGFGLKATAEDLLYLVRRPGLLARSLLAMFVIVPLAAVLLARAFEFRHTVEVALVALAFAPIPPLIPQRLTELKGRESHAIALTVTVAVLAIVIVPLLVELLERYAGKSYAVSPWRVAGIVAMTVLVPLGAGMLLRAVRPALAERIEPVASSVGGVLLRVAALVLLVTSLPALWALLGEGTIFAMVMFVVVALAAGHLLGGPDAEGRVVLAVATASRHPAIALAVASANFPEERFGATIVLYLLVNVACGVPYLMWQRKKVRDAEAAAAILEARNKAADDIKAGRPAPYYVAEPAASAPVAPSVPVRDGPGASKAEG
jgi:bile acid:Na+ symporter, BASS family